MSTTTTPERIIITDPVAHKIYAKNLPLLAAMARAVGGRWEFSHCGPNREMMLSIVRLDDPEAYYALEDEPEEAIGECTVCDEDIFERDDIKQAYGYMCHTECYYSGPDGE